MQNRVRWSRPNRLKSILLSCAALPLLGAPLADTQEMNSRTGTELFTGCDDEQVLVRQNRSPRDTIMSAAGRVDPKTNLIFKSFSVEEAAQVNAPEFDGECWSRLDGLWREQMRVSFDSSIRAEGWAAQSPASVGLTHGMRTTPDYVRIEHDETGQLLHVYNALGDGTYYTYESQDEVPLADVFSRKVKSKTYFGEGRGNRRAKIVFDVSSRGHMRLKMGRKTFIRPRPEISENTRSEQVGSSDLFAVAYNPRNLRAVRQGYDVTMQDPNSFLENGGLLNVFAPSKPRDYYVSEQMTVPLGLHLISGGNKQVMVYYETLVATARQYQEANRTAFGVNVGLKGKSGGNEKSYDPVAASVGYRQAKEEAISQTEKNSVATIHAYQRSKKYTLVRDHAYTDLSDEFVDAVIDAYESGDYTRIIDDFGTHYPYAVTYGTAGRLSTYMTEETFAQNRRDFQERGGNAGFSIGPVSADTTYESKKDIGTGSSSTNKFGETVFSAVGGNGSWDQNGFSAGDSPYPILTDMRPLDQLLSPIYFPDQPEIYNEARAKLTDAIYDYLIDRPALTDTSRLSNIQAYQEEHTYRITLKSLECIRAGSWEGTGNPVQIHGWMKLRFHTELDMFGSGKVHAWHSKRDTNDDYAEIPCPGGEENIVKDAARRDFTGTREQLDRGKWSIGVNLWEWDWGLDAADGQEHIRDLPSPKFDVPHLNIGETGTVSWNVPVHKKNRGMPQLKVNVEFERLE